MTDSTGGFSFGGSNPPDDFDDIDAIEVDSEPVSRKEAKNMGIVAHDTSREAKNATSLMRLDQLPSDISGDLTKKLKTAWTHLKRNETDEALTLAQEVVFEYPSLVAAKLIIARCYINKKEYTKSLAILQAIPEADRSAEVLYYIGLSQSRLGRIKEAIDALKSSRASTGDTLIRKRTGDLLMQLQGEQTVCPLCGKKTLYDNMVDVGNQTVCANCAKNLPAEDEEDDEDEDDEEEDEEESSLAARRRRKRLRPPLSRTDILMRVALGLLLLLVLGLGLFAVSILAPESYASLRSFIPFLPGSSRPTAHVVPPPRVVETTVEPALSFDSPGLNLAVVGAELRHRLEIAGMEKRDINYGVSFKPPPAGKHSLDPQSGLFVWTPDDRDAGKEFQITFTASLQNVRARDQVNTVKVSRGPRFKNVVGTRKPKPGQAIHLLADDLDNHGADDLIVVSGDAWQGDIAIYRENDDGFFQESARTTLGGRPAGAGVLLADDEKWVAVADYWHSRLRHYALRDGKLSEMAMAIDLPGRPMLAGFDRKGSMSAILCHTDKDIKVACFRQDGQLRFSPQGVWTLPDEFVWRRVLIIPAATVHDRPLPIVFGGDVANAVFVLPEDGRLVQVKLPLAGNLMDAAVGSDGRVYCLVQDGETMKVARFLVDATGKPESLSVAAAGEGPAFAGVAGVSLRGVPDETDALFWSTQQLGVSFALPGGELATAARWDLPKPARPLGGAVSLTRGGTEAARAVFMDTGGDLWTVTLEGE